VRGGFFGNFWCFGGVYAIPPEPSHSRRHFDVYDKPVVLRVQHA
jgi:hypothetical protein